MLNSDYFGESKKGGLRMWNNIVYNCGGLSLHAGCKVIRVGGRAAMVAKMKRERSEYLAPFDGLAPPRSSSRSPDPAGRRAGRDPPPDSLVGDPRPSRPALIRTRAGRLLPPLSLALCR